MILSAQPGGWLFLVPTQGSQVRSFDGIADDVRRQRHESGLRFVSFGRQRFQSSHLRRGKRTGNRRGAVIGPAGVCVVRAGIGKARLDSVEDPGFRVLRGWADPQDQGSFRWLSFAFESSLGGYGLPLPEVCELLIEAREELAQGGRGGGLRGCRGRERRPQQPCVRHALDHWNARLWRYLQGPLSRGSE